MFSLNAWNLFGVPQYFRAISFGEEDQEFYDQSINSQTDDYCSRQAAYASNVLDMI